MSDPRILAINAANQSNTNLLKLTKIGGKRRRRKRRRKTTRRKRGGGGGGNVAVAPLPYNYLNPSTAETNTNLQATSNQINADRQYDAFAKV
jgi:hypothetical protein